jgi:hypothetical protein
MWTAAPCNRDVDLRLGRRVCEAFGWRSFSFGSRGRKKVEEEEEEKEQERAAGGRASERRGSSFDSVFFPLLTLPTQVLLAYLLACLHTLLTLWGSSRNLELCGVQKLDFVFLTLMRIWEYKKN